MSSQRLAWSARTSIATAFLAGVAYVISQHAMPWALSRLPLAAPLALFFLVTLLSTAWATLDVYRGVGSDDQ